MDSDLPEYLRLVLALIFVLSLMGGLAYLLKRFGLGGPTAPLPGRLKRMKVIESLALDPRRRAVILRHDNKEHLVILGPSGETLIDTNIASAPVPLSLKSLKVEDHEGKLENTKH